MRELFLKLHPNLPNFKLKYMILFKTMSKKAAYHHILAIYRGGSENDVLLFFALIFNL